MILYFQNSQGIEKEIGQPNTIEETQKIISDYLAERKFKAYYTRMQIETDGAMRKKKPNCTRMILDVGSWSEFFILETNGTELDNLIP